MYLVLPLSSVISALLNETVSTVPRTVSDLLPHFSVIGVDRLRVVDASVMPTLISGTPNSVITVIAEKAAHMIRVRHEVWVNEVFYFVFQEYGKCCQPVFALWSCV